MVRNFNLDVSKDNHYVNRLLNIFLSMGLKQYVDKPTRVTNNSETIIDLFFSNFHIKTEVLMKPEITDQNIVIVVIDNNEANNKGRTFFYKRDYSTFSENAFNEVLNNKMNLHQDG